MNSLQILLLILCVVDLYKNKKILSPTFLFNFIFFVTYSLYEWDFSYIQQKLSSKTELIFFNCVVFYNLTYYCFKKYFNLKKIDRIISDEEKESINKKIRIAKYIAIIGFIVELIYSRGCPLLWKFTGDPRTYFDFGIPSLNGALYGLIICLGAYSLFSKSKDKYLYLSMGILMISRQVIMSIMIEGIIYFILSHKNKINYLKIIILLSVLFVGFTVVGNFRSGKGIMNETFKPKNNYKFLPDSIKWAYSYMTFSVSNLNYLVSVTDGGVNKGASTLNELLPTVLLNKINIKEKVPNSYLVSPSYNTSTYLPSLYLDFGIVGIAIFNSLIAIFGCILFEKVTKRCDDKSILMYSVFAHNIILLFFINMFLYLPIVIQFVYIPLIFGYRNKKGYLTSKSKKFQKNNSIVMATYNGEKYIKEQIDSILLNMGDNDELIISDDGSKDKTVKIIKDYMKKDSRIILIDGPKKGIKQNFANAISHASGKYIYLSDQDDVWNNDKIKVMSKYLKQYDCVTHNAKIVNSNLEDTNLTCFEFRKSAKGKIKNIYKNRYIGCCMAFKAELIDFVLPIPDEIEMHDQWIGLIAEKYGKSIFVNDCLIKYRRHENNSSQMKHYPFTKMVKNRIIFIKNYINR